MPSTELAPMAHICPYPHDRRYLITSLGEVYSTISGRKLRPGRMNSYGHVSVAIGKGNSKCVHTLVLETFIGPRPHQHDAAHTNCDGGDNRLSNLRWATRSENNCDTTRAGRRKLTPAQVREMRHLREQGWVLQSLAERFGTTLSCTSKICLGNMYASIT